MIRTKKKRKATYLIIFVLLVASSIYAIFNHPLIAALLVFVFFLMVFFQGSFYKALSKMGLG